MQAAVEWILDGMGVAAVLACGACTARIPPGCRKVYEGGAKKPQAFGRATCLCLEQRPDLSAFVVSSEGPCSSRRSRLQSSLVRQRGVVRSAQGVGRIKTDSKASSWSRRRPVPCDSLECVPGSCRMCSKAELVDSRCACDDRHYLGHLRSAMLRRGAVRCAK